MKQLLFNIFKGFLYGTFSVLPGLSGGILANYFNDYEILINFFALKTISKNTIVYVLELFLGIISGIILSSRFILSIYQNNYQLLHYFIILVNIIIITKYYKKNTIKTNLFIIFISLIIQNISIKINCSNIHLNHSTLLIIFSSILYSISKIIPGISSTTMLINFGLYDDIMGFYASPIQSLQRNIFVWLSFWSIFIITSIILLKLISKIINRNEFKLIIYIILLCNFIKILKG